MYGDIGNEEISKICRSAIKSGVNFIDTSPWYRSSQENIGKVLKLEGIPRKAFYIATKVAFSTHIQGDPSGCSLTVVDNRTKVAFEYRGHKLKHKIF